MNFFILLSKFLILLLLQLFILKSFSHATQPNIVFILADDLGYHDVGYHSPEIYTPNIDYMAANGVRLEQYYTQPYCNPTRASLLTGRYPIHLGYQRVGTANELAFGLPLNISLLPQKLKEVGYSTHIVGKWHLGYYKSEYLPTSRGFDSFLGIYASSLYHYSHISYNLRPRPGPSWGLDLHNGSACLHDQNNTYSLTIFLREIDRIILQHNTSKPLFLYFPMQLVHTPNEVPSRYEKYYNYLIGSEDRKIFCGMVSAMDEGVGHVVSSLKAKGELFWNNTIVVFASDNGGWTKFGSSGINYPLRGGKFTLFEGGVRVPSLVYSPLLKNPGRIERNLIHVSDWYPTFCSLAGAHISPQDEKKLDGVNQWDVISKGINDESEAPRSEILHNMKITSTIKSMTAAIRVGKWKLLTGQWANCGLRSNPLICGWIRPSTFESFERENNANISSQQLLYESSDYSEDEITYYPSTVRNSNQTPKFFPYALYNINNDPNEFYDLSIDNLDVVCNLIGKLHLYYESSLPMIYQKREWNKMASAAMAKGCLTPWDDSN